MHENELKDWWRKGIRAVVILIEEHEMHIPIERYKAYGFDILWEPIRDMSAPTLSTLKRIVEWIDEKIYENKPVLVHCYGGMGRTGTILAAYLVYKGWDPIRAIEFVRSIRPGAIQVTAQYATVIEFANFIKYH